MVYDIRTEPWIPVQVIATGDVREVGLRELLSQAQDYRQISGENAMETYSMYRFLSIFLLRICQPKDWESKFELLDEGRFAMEQVEDYFRQCELQGISFDLFDTKRPFLQAVPDGKLDTEKTLKSIASLDGTRASGNNPIHFDHTLECDAEMTPAQAMRGLLSSQIFATAMSGGYPSNVYGAPPMFFLPEGRNLFETLVLSIPLVNRENFGQPVWESNKPIIPREEVPATNQLYGLLFPARRIRLVPPTDGVVKTMFYQPGLHFIGFSSWKDPHVARRPNKDGDFVSIKPSIDREPWRNMGTLTQYYHDGAPEVLRDFAHILQEDGRNDMPVMMFGLATSNASLLGIQQGKIYLDNRIMADNIKMDALIKALELSERFAMVLRNSKTGIISIIAPEATGRGQHEAEVYLHRYFAYCERELHGYIERLAEISATEEYHELRQLWKNRLITGIRELVQEAERIYCFRGADMIRAYKQEQFLFATLKKAVKEVENGAESKG
ncbi:type I-E CRISPR-associated protein Cse1/CasA [Selenomonas ruminantium]|uniref:CRISPR type I-E/ECOLI-associated protein CasA/Cse1 n=1 Tax=Selenomonas ruminantium TaxID=971 RepID=A0A1K1M1B9_SELRU|nr:type I-E CRISPR-associated protein Cse1/CasA [Selenomonas ruminantium]SFW16931.1 CRISPR type I-E/ECOLI-associated protein CasA/Cse1 [Selenomonas ruminantium]